MSRPEPLGPPLLTADWRWLAMLSYEIDEKALGAFVPPGTELDRWEGRTIVSVIAFLFLRARFLGVAVPFHRSFEEVNLRLYVRRRAQEGWRRGVVFVKELVPRRMIAWTARLLYNENYFAARLGHRLREDATGPDVSYWWQLAGQRGELHVAARGEPRPLREGTEEEFIAEHYWGYARQRDGTTLEYRVEHPRWRVWPASRAELRCNAATLFGPPFANCLSAAPVSAFLAEGSAVSVYRGSALRD